MIQYVMHSPEQLGTLIAAPPPPLTFADTGDDDIGQSIVTLLEDIATAYHEMEKKLQTQQHPAAQLAQTLFSWQNIWNDDEIKKSLSAELNALRPRKLKKIHTTLTTCLTLLNRTNWQSFFEMRIQSMLAILSAYSHTSTAFTQLFIRSRRDSFSRYCQTSVRVLAWCGFSHYKQMVETQRKKYQSSLAASLLSDILSQKGPNPNYQSDKEKKYEQKAEADMMARNPEYRRLSYTTALHTRINTLQQGLGCYRRKMAIQKNKKERHPSLLQPTLFLFSAPVAPPKKKVRFNFDSLSHASASPGPVVFQPPPL